MVLLPTHHFVTKSKAIEYYMDYYPDFPTTKKEVTNLIDKGEIVIGKPNTQDKISLHNREGRYYIHRR